MLIWKSLVYFFYGLKEKSGIESRRLGRTFRGKQVKKEPTLRCTAEKERRGVGSDSLGRPCEAHDLHFAGTHPFPFCLRTKLSDQGHVLSLLIFPLAQPRQECAAPFYMMPYQCLPEECSVGIRGQSILHGAQGQAHPGPRRNLVPNPKVIRKPHLTSAD